MARKYFRQKRTADAKCPKCGKICKSEGFLARHMNYSHNEIIPNYPNCHYCSKSYSKPIVLIDHIMQNHVSESQKEIVRPQYGAKERHDSKSKPSFYECDHCNKHFTARSALVRHFQYVKYRKLFQCDICLKYLSKKSSLKLHMIALHPKIQNKKAEKLSLKKRQGFHCDFCKKRFTLKYGRDHHMRMIHSGNKFICDICHKEYPYKKSLASHLQIVHHFSNFKCLICNRNFLRKKYLKRHEYYHQEWAQTWQCKFCSKMCQTKHGLTCHMEKMHGSKSYKKSAVSKTINSRDIPKNSESITMGAKDLCAKIALVQLQRLQLNSNTCSFTLHDGVNPHSNSEAISENSQSEYETVSYCNVVEHIDFKQDTELSENEKQLNNKIKNEENFEEFDAVKNTVINRYTHIKNNSYSSNEINELETDYVIQTKLLANVNGWMSNDENKTNASSIDIKTDVENGNVLPNNIFDQDKENVYNFYDNMIHKIDEEIQ